MNNVSHCRCQKYRLILYGILYDLSLIHILPAAAGLSPLIIIPIGIAVLAVIVRILGKSTRLEDLHKEEENTKVC